ncbi:hypothetical protein Ais01nite_18330 [Asanoa ishikariensis]|uniref:Predicted dithiol-disulfide oxidoreductase, DUF899 family n=1 Tax=Asanoa ishikariensis TaxID=137265 RepID=A0A1H3UDH0_9ACTN|nr:DUF899 domain-containing protein [Asanoa ishikariensis]GIF63798.1 hypothetical protein Ais01nite_18330 [Asanoa ishikariensis]SDZ60396.1 Predicted dithiol-disulfide oxidoreductase, DUF899 family [Asanoa ishikariensis]
MGTMPEVVSREEWLTARAELLVKEKELTRARDRVNADRRRLPMVRVDKAYEFDGPDGPVGLADLFEGRPQLVLHHFMFAPEWEAACPSCSSAADQIGAVRQLHARNTTLVAVSRAPHPKLAAFRERMGWTFPWYSAYGNDFNEDFGATVEGGEMPGVSAFLRVGDDVFHTYSTFSRGIEEFHNGYPYLDLTALGRQEAWEEPKGRAEPLGLQAGGPAMRLPDEY